MGAWLTKVLSLVLGGLLARVIVGAGMTILTYAGITVAVQGLLDELVQHMTELPAAVLNIALLFGVGEAINIIGSAMLTVLAWKSLGLGVAFSNQVNTPP